MASTSTATISTSFTTKRSGRSTRKGKEREVNVIPYTNLLGAGTLSFTLHGLTSYFDDNAVAEDGWYILKDFLGIRTCVDEDRVWILDCLLFLQTNAFVQATHTILSNSMLMVRIYLIPYDLPGSKGALRNRDEMKVMIPGRKALRELLAHLSKDTASWMGSERSKFVSFFEDQNRDDRTLAQIFNGLTTTENEFELDDIPHLRTSLYGYQRESVATMLRREQHNIILDDPLYISMTTIEDKTYYLQPATLEVLLECPQFAQSKGGFLCEELGTGKTIMILSLILASRKALPKPPEEMTDDSSVLTPLSLRYFPYPQHISARKLAMRGKPRSEHRLPSLVEICCDSIRSSPEEVDFEQYEEELEMRGLWEPINSNAPFYLHLDRNFMRETPGLRQKMKLPRIMYLSPATIIVVPRTLVAQWRSEVLKHCSASVRHLVIKGSTKIPPAHKLASDYDIIIISDSRISTETSLSNESTLHIGYTCRCKPFARIRVPDCSCEAPKGASTLLQVRWKRLVRDEGHNAVSLSTNLNHFLRLLGAERRWIVTGTPTTNLLGLSLGKASDAAEEEDISPAFLPEDDAARDSQLLPSKRVWRSSDREDVRKLGSMMESFLCVQRFSADPRAFETLVAAPLFRHDGPLPGAVQVLTQVMTAYMIRHRIEDIEKDVLLPPMKEETILLDLDPYAQMSFNVFLSSIVINAVDSERRDQDYLFHPFRSYQLAATIENLSHALFWRVDDDSCDLDLNDTILRAQDTIVHATERQQPEEDLRLVEKAIIHLRKAHDDPLFRAMQHGMEVPYRVHGLSDLSVRAWGAFHSIQTPSQNFATQCFMYPRFALELRQTVERQPLISEPRLAEIGELVRDAEAKLTALADARMASLKSGKEDRKGKNKVREEQEVGKLRLKHVHKAVDTKAKLEERQREYKAAQDRLMAMAKDEASGEGVISIPSSHSKDSVDDPSGSNSRPGLLRSSCLADVRIGSSTSSKLNYILEEVRKYSATEKILIFSNQPFNLVHIAEGLELIGIKFLQFTTESGADRRDQDLTTFETSETYRVFLMELRYGARGLNIVSASRVIFCEPVWQADVESQAIKRVHRIGQTRPVTVKTLAIRDTFEEYMIERRKAFKGANTKTPGIMEEGGIRYYLQNPSFLEREPKNVDLDFPFLHLSRDTDVDSSERENVLVSEDIDKNRVADENSGIKRKIRITFKAYSGDGRTDRVLLDDVPSESTEETPPRQRRKVVHFA